MATWLDIEQSLCENLHISDIPFLSQSIKHHPCFKSLTIASALTAWWKYHHITNSNQAPSELTPLWNNPDFTSNKKTLNFHKWAQKGISHLKHIFQSNNFVSFSYLVQEYGIGSNQFLNYLQLKSAVLSKINNRTINTHLPSALADLINISSPKKLLSKIYKIIANSNKSITLPTIKWKEDLSIAPDTDFWTQICKNIYSMTKNANLQLIQYKTLHRTHYTGERLAKMGFTSGICLHCSQNCPDTYIHATWHCPPIKHFCKDVTESLSHLLGCRIPLSPLLCLLGDLSTLNQEITNTRMLLVALAIGKKTIFLNWKSRSTIHITHWKNLLIEYISLEYFTPHYNCISEPRHSRSDLIQLLQI